MEEGTEWDETHSKHTQRVCCLPARASGVNSKAEGEREQPEEEEKRKRLML